MDEIRKVDIPVDQKLYNKSPIIFGLTVAHEVFPLILIQLLPPTLCSQPKKLLFILSHGGKICKAQASCFKGACNYHGPTQINPLTCLLEVAN